MNRRIRLYSLLIGLAIVGIIAIGNAVAAAFPSTAPPSLRTIAPSPPATTALTNCRPACRPVRWPPWSPPASSTRLRAPPAPSPACRPPNPPPSTPSPGGRRSTSPSTPSAPTAPTAWRRHAPPRPAQGPQQRRLQPHQRPHRDHHRPGRTWARRAEPQLSRLGLGVPGWLGMGFNSGTSASPVSFCTSPKRRPQAQPLHRRRRLLGGR